MEADWTTIVTGLAAIITGIAGGAFGTHRVFKRRNGVAVDEIAPRSQALDDTQMARYDQEMMTQLFALSRQQAQITQQLALTDKEASVRYEAISETAKAQRELVYVVKGLADDIRDMKKQHDHFDAKQEKFDRRQEELMHAVEQALVASG